MSINAIIRKYNIDFSLSSSVLYTECNPFVKANNPFPADHNVNKQKQEIIDKVGDLKELPKKTKIKNKKETK